MVSALQASGSYMQFSENRDAMLYVPEMSRRARGIEMWALLKTLGRRGVDTMIAQLCDRAKLFAKLLAEHGFHMLNDVVFNQVMIACDTPELTLATLNNIQKDRVCWCGTSKWNGDPVIRISVCSWATTEDDVRLSVESFARSHEQAKKSTVNS